MAASAVRSHTTHQPSSLPLPHLSVGWLHQRQRQQSQGQRPPLGAHHAAVQGPCVVVCVKRGGVGRMGASSGGGWWRRNSPTAAACSNRPPPAQASAGPASTHTPHLGGGRRISGVSWGPGRSNQRWRSDEACVKAGRGRAVIDALAASVGALWSTKSAFTSTEHLSL